MNISGKIVNKCYIVREKVSEIFLGSFWKVQPIYSAKDFLLFFLNDRITKKARNNFIELKRSLLFSTESSNESLFNPVEIDEFEGYPYISFEIGESISLIDILIKKIKLKKKDIIKIIEGLKNCLDFIHKENIHGLILPECIWIESKNDKINKAGILNIKYNDLSAIQKINVDRVPERFFSPEFLSNYSIKKNQIKSDYYSIGIILYILLTGNINFKKNEIKNINENIKLNIDFKIDKHALVNILKKILSVNIKNRYDDLNQFLDDIYSLFKESRKYNTSRDKDLKNKNIKKEKISFDYSISEEQEGTEVDYSSKETVSYFSGLDDDRKKYYSKSNNEYLNAYFEKLENERREYFNGIRNERSIFLDKIINETQQYFNELARRQKSEKELHKEHLKYFDNISSETKSYADYLSDNIKKYFKDLNENTKSDIKKLNFNEKIINPYFNNIVRDTGRYYLKLADESKKYFVNLTNEVKRYSSSTSEIDSLNDLNNTLNKDIEKSESDFEKILDTTVKYMDKLENEVKKYANDTLLEVESKKEDLINENKDRKEFIERSEYYKSREMLKAGEDRDAYYKKKTESKDYFTDEKRNSKKQDELEDIKNESDFSVDKKSIFLSRDDYYKDRKAESTEERKNYYDKKRISDENLKIDKLERDYQKIDFDVENKRYDRDTDKAGKEISDKGSILKKSKPSKTDFSFRNDFIKKNHSINFLKKLYKYSLRSYGNICFINNEENSNLTDSLNNFKKYLESVKSVFLDINCVNISDNLFLRILKKYSYYFYKFDDDLKNKIRNNIDKKLQNKINLIHNNYKKDSLFGNVEKEFTVIFHRKNNKVLDAAAELICNLGIKKYPIIIFVDNFHLINNNDLLLLEYIIKRITDYPVLIIGIYTLSKVKDNDLQKLLT